ncbi:MAG TPA: DUF4056 domain-containing protein [Myxococcota bacterium]|nr:DUF4056 domain-containing protein [Myxococcota bacterium]
MVVPLHPLRSACCALLLVCAIGCDRERWSVGEKIRASDIEVATALGDTSQQSVDELAATEVPAIAYPQALRPCCAFGADLKVAVGQMAMPGVEIANLLDVRDVGAHRYDNGYLSLQRGDPRGLVDDENNGLVYTCRGGFIDLAHVRDNADNTLALAAAVARSLETGGSVDVPPQGAAMRVRLRAVKPEAIRKYGRMQLAAALAQWIAYQLSIWHEIATFYGYASLANWPEKISAFSPEDLYSNQIGVRLAAGVILSKGARSDLEYALSMDAWIQRALERLGAVPEKDALAAMRAVDGAWWDSEKRIPDWTLVKRRQFETDPYLRPWRIEDASPGARGTPQPLARCRDAGPALVLHVVDGFAGAQFRDYASLELDVDESLVEAGFPLPRADSRCVTQGDFPSIIDAARKQTIELLGNGADAP